MKRVYSIFAVLVLGMALLFANIPVALAGSSLSSSQVSAYKQAKAAGKLVEQGSGYLQPGSGASGSLISIMKEINRMRRDKYQAIANKNGVPLQAVERSAGSKLTGR